MADLEYTVGVNTRRAQQSLQRLQTTTAQTTEVFGRLRSAIAGLAIGNFIRTSFQAAAAIDNLSQSTGIAAETIVGFSRAFSAAGGTIDRARDGISDFSKNVGEAAQSSKELREAFGRAGISLEDLATLSTDDLFAATIEGLAEIDDQSDRTATALRIFGESFKGIPIDQLNASLDENIRTSGDAARAYREAGEASRNLSNAIAVLREELVIALAPFAEFTASLDANREVISGVIKVLVNLAILLGTLKVAKTIGTMFIGLGAAARTGFGIASRTAGMLTEQLGLLRTSASTAIPATLGTRLTALAQLLPLIARNILRLIPIVAKLSFAFLVLDNTIKSITGRNLLAWLDDVTSESTKAGILINRLRQSLGQVDDAEVEINVKSTNPGAPGGDSGERSLEREQEVQRNIVDLLKEQKFQIDELTRSYELRVRNTVASLREEQQLLGIKEEERDIQRTINDFNRQYEEQIGTLRTKLRQLNLEPEKNAELIQRVNRAIEESTEEYIRQLPVVQELAAQNDAIRKSQEAAAEAQRRVQSAAERTNVFLVDLNDSTEEMRNELMQLDMTPLQRQLSEIERQISIDARNAISDLYDDLQNAPTPAAQQEIEKQIQRIEEQSQAAIRTQQQIAEEAYEYQRSFSFGWREAFKEYADEATNAANKARRVFELSTRGMEDAIVNFAKTGKFEWRSFVSSIVEELLRQQVRQLIAQTFAPIFGGGSGGSSENGNLFGGFFATGGQIPAGRFGVVGENGPELVSGPADVTPDIGGTNVTYNINAVDAQSFQQLVARDPQFIFAVTEQGRRSLPQTRR